MSLTLDIEVSVVYIITYEYILINCTRRGDRTLRFVISRIILRVD